MDIGVGRFPVWNETDAATMVEKTISYMNGDNSGEWQNNIVVLGDDGDNNLHMSQADRLAEMILKEDPSLNVRKIYWDTYKMEASAAGNTYPAARDEIFRQLDNGALLVNYTGHGSPSVLSHEMVFGMSDFASLTSPSSTAASTVSLSGKSCKVIARWSTMNPVVLSSLTTKSSIP